MKGVALYFEHKLRTVVVSYLNIFFLESKQVTTSDQGQ